MVCIQQGLFEPKAPQTQGPTAALAAPEPGDPFVQSAKMMVRLKSLAGTMNAANAQQLFEAIGEPGPSKPDQFRHALVAAEFLGSAAAKERLDAIDKAEPTTGPDSLTAEEEQRLDEQVNAVRTILDGNAKTLTSQQRDALIADHGYLGELILTFGQPDNDPARAPLVAGGVYIILFVLLLFAIVVVGGLGGLAACIVFFVRLGSGKIKPAFVAPAPGGSVYLETIALFIGSFLALLFITHALFGPDAINAKLLCQWLALLVPFWPLARGVAAKDFRLQLGLHTGKGFWREVGAGIFAYFAAIPFLAVVATLAILYLRGTAHNGQVSGPPDNPIQDIINHGNSTTLLLFFVLATVWAPLTEEMIFRGALFRHLRGRVGMLAAAAISAIVFGFMHPYPLPLMSIVITLGFAFALTREWRGSLIASMVGHFLHNSTLLTLGILIVQAGK